MKKVKILLFSLLLSIFVIPICSANAATNHIRYQVYDNVKGYWLPNVIDDQDYAGNFGNPIGGIYMNFTNGGNITYRVHQYNGDYWLPAVTNRNDYAGNLGQAINGVQIISASSPVSYILKFGDMGWSPIWWHVGDEALASQASKRTIDAIQMIPYYVQNTRKSEEFIEKLNKSNLDISKLSEAELFEALDILE